jgi:hypothetical protein
MQLARGGWGARWLLHDPFAIGVETFTGAREWLVGCAAGVSAHPSPASLSQLLD